MVMSKGERTKAVILDEALALTSLEGLNGLTIGILAERLNMSKSGLFAHFGSKEMLQQAVLERAVEMFADFVVRPALEQPRGRPQLDMLLERWIAWDMGDRFPGACPLQCAAIELDDKPGPLRDYVVSAHERLRQVLIGIVRAAKEEGHLGPATDPEQLAFELVGIAYGFTHMHRLMCHPDAGRWARAAFAALMDRYELPPR